MSSTATPAMVVGNRRRMTLWGMMAKNICAASGGFVQEITKSVCSHMIDIVGNLTYNRARKDVGVNIIEV